MQSPSARPWRLAAAGALLLLGGCSAYNRGIASVQFGQAPEQSDDQVDQIDGTYKGLATVEEASGPACPPAQVGTIEIGDHSLFFGYTPSIVFISVVQPDGTLAGQAGDATLAGRLDGGVLRFTVTSPSCRVSYRFRYVI